MSKPRLNITLYVIENAGLECYSNIGVDKARLSKICYYCVLMTKPVYNAKCIVLIKGQLISKCPFDDIVWTKITTKFFSGFLH